MNPEDYSPEKEMDFAALNVAGSAVDPKDTSLRGLVIEKPAIIPLGDRQKSPDGTNQDSRARSFIFRNLDANRLSFLLYPYNFTYYPGDTSSSGISASSGPVGDSSSSDSSSIYIEPDVEQTFPDGALLSDIDTDGFPDHAYMKWLKATTDIDLKKAKPIYDVNIAVLQIQWEAGNESYDITYDSDRFCSLFYNQFYPKYRKCFKGYPEYDAYIKKYPLRATEPTFVFVTPTDIVNGSLLSEDGIPRFGTLFFPDIMFSELRNATSLFGATGKSNLKKFVQAGGVLSTTGKGALLLETLGIVGGSEVVFDTSRSIISPNATTVYLDGCDKAANGQPEDNSEGEFTKRTLCFSHHHVGNSKMIYGALLSSPILYKTPQELGFTPLLWLVHKTGSARLMIHNEITGLSNELPDGDVPRKYPAMMYKKMGKGFIVVHLANPAYSSWTAQYVYNTVFFAGSRPLALDNSLTGDFNRTIPALEPVQLSMTLSLKNFFTTEVSGGLTLKVYQRSGTTVTAPSGFTKSNVTDVPNKVLDGIVFTKTISSIAATSNQDFKFVVKVTDISVTQAAKDIIILYPVLSFTDPRSSKPETLTAPVTIAAAGSALLRGEMNIDPSSAYPLLGSGSYIDNVLNCENKEATEARRVQQISIVPIISPLIGISDQVKLARALYFDKDYYKKDINSISKYVYPFPEGGNENDFLDWDLLYERGDILAANWDEGVKLFREQRDKYHLSPAIGFNPTEKIPRASYQTNIDNDLLLLRQAQFYDSDKFYEHATQRMMAFLDIHSEKGARTYFGGDIPEINRSASNPKIGKSSILFVRHDVFFWKKYVMPQGFNDENRNDYITVDRFPERGTCGDSSDRPFPGVYKNDDGIIPAHFRSSIAISSQRCGRGINLTDVEAKSHGKIKVVHYIVPVEPVDGKTAGDFIGFDPVTGFHKQYPEISFQHVLQAKFHIDAAKSRRGGLMVFKFPSAPFANMEKAIKDGNVTVAADQIAVYDIFVKGTNQLAIRFKRGMLPNEAYGRGSYLEVYLENTILDLSVKHIIPMDLYDMTYDISSPQTGYEDWSVKTVSDMSIEFNATGALRLPAVRFNFQLADKLEDSFMNPYELREPLVRYGMYEQELLLHRPVHGADEFHPKMEPCIVTNQGGFSAFTHVGTSSVPFREYVTLGDSLRIPGSSETGRIEWEDIWGRHFVQSVRSTIFEYPPIPPPLRNFEMTTTFQLLTKDGKRMQQWRSNEAVDVHAQLKLVNNYPKYFEITVCKANVVNQLCTGENHICGVPRVFIDDPRYSSPRLDKDSGRQFFTQGHNASYGICFRDPDVYLQGQGPLTSDKREKIQMMTLCAENVGSYDRSCEKNADGLPTLGRRPDGNEADPYNFAQQVKDFYPANYIKPNMWDMTHYDYYDNQFDKAYKYHVDNRLPSIRSGLGRPQNHIAFPLYKGFGYSMTYNKTYSNPRFPKYRGWWSDNLQNHDHTLFAQQKESHDISLGRKNAIEFFDHDLYEDASDLVRQAEKNVYRCHFTRKVPYIYADAQRGFFLDNVFENNVVPVPVGFNDQMEKNYRCDKTYYSPENISQYDNIVYTDSARDWLYFASNLRGNALEDLNIIYSLTPLQEEGQDIKYEGLAKVQDGGRFTYWNPVNGPNSYLIVDNPVHTVLAMRNDIEIAQELIPTYTTTFDSNVYHHITISDPEEIEREWELPTWTNNYGYGDFNVQVFVGDAGTTALPEPGKTIRIHYTFMNNAGFNINMLKNAINSTTINQESINSYQLMYNIVVAVKVPESYNFLNLTIPDEIKPYITIKPSKGVVGVAPLFFDFDSINVVTIRDGWKGDYYFDLTVSKNFPDHLRGRLNEIKVEVVRKYFDNFPGVGDPTGVHDYTVEIPPIMFGVPYGKNSEWAGKVFYTSGYATELHNTINVRDPYIPKEAIFVSEDDLEEFRACLGSSSDPDQEAANGEFTCLDKLWAKKNATNTHCEYTLTKAEGSVVNSVDFAPGLAVRAPEFPVKVAAKDGPDAAVLHIMLRTYAPQIESGNPIITTGMTASALDWMGKKVTSEPQPQMTIHSKGAWLQLGWNMKLLSSTGLELQNDLLTPEDSGMADITITLTNTGDYYAYNVSFSLSIPVDVRPAYTGSGIEASIDIPPGCFVGKNATNSNETVFSCYVAHVMVPRSPTSFLFRVQFDADTRDGAGAKAKAPLDMHIMAKSSRAQIDLTSTAGEKTVVQDLLGPYGFKYTSDRDTNLAVLTATRDSSYQSTFKVSHRLSGVTYYVWRAKPAGSDQWTNIAVTSEKSLKENVKERFKALGGRGGVKVDYVVSLTTTKTKPTLNDTVICLTQTNIYKWSRSNSNLLLLLLLLPGLLVPAFVGAAIFSTKKGTTVQPSADLGLSRRQKFIPQEMVDEEFEVTEMDMAEPPPSLPQRPAAYEAPELEPAELAQPGKTYTLHTGPTYVQGGRGVQIVDSSH